MLGNQVAYGKLRLISECQLISIKLSKTAS
jgi:hypothetical protein